MKNKIVVYFMYIPETPTAILKCCREEDYEGKVAYFENLGAQCVRIMTTADRDKIIDCLEMMEISVKYCKRWIEMNA